jgi:hypothetical protein
MKEMEIKILTSKTLPLGIKSSEPSVRFDKSGVIQINEAACKLLNLGPESTIAFGTSEKPKDWYIMAHPDGYKVRRDKDRPILMLNHIEISNQIRSSLGEKISAMMSPKEFPAVRCKLAPVTTEIPEGENVIIAYGLLKVK